MYTGDVLCGARPPILQICVDTAGPRWSISSRQTWHLNGGNKTAA